MQPGESAALGELMEKHWSGLVRYATSLLGCGDAAEDVAQAVFVHVWETRREWSESLADLTSFDVDGLDHRGVPVQGVQSVLTSQVLQSEIAGDPQRERTQRWGVALCPGA